jgi:hypothetical protein
MGFLIESFTLLGLQLQNIYVSIHGSYNISKPSFLNPQLTPEQLGAVYNITYSYTLSQQNSSEILQTKVDFIPLNVLPSEQTLFDLIYNDIKNKLDPNFGKPEQTLIFHDDL